MHGCMTRPLTSCRVQGGQHEGPAAASPPDARHRGGSAALRQLSMVQEHEPPPAEGRPGVAGTSAEPGPRSLPRLSHLWKHISQLGEETEPWLSPRPPVSPKPPIHAAGSPTHHGTMKSGDPMFKATAAVDVPKGHKSQEDLLHNKTDALLKVRAQPFVLLRCTTELLLTHLEPDEL
jgi:hypothetical protein